MALTLPSGYDLRDILGETCKRLALCGLPTRHPEWQSKPSPNATIILKDWDINSDYAKTAPDMANRAPTEAEVQATADAITAARTAAATEKADDASERSNAQSAIMTLTSAASQASFTNAQRDSVMKILCRVAVWLVKRELKR